MPIARQVCANYVTAAIIAHGAAQPSPAQPSTAQHSTAQHGTARHGTARHSMFWRSMAWQTCAALRYVEQTAGGFCHVTSIEIINDSWQTAAMGNKT